MSGGYFDNRQYHLGEIADSIKREIEYATGPRPPLVEKEGVKKAEIYAQRVDWLISGDDGEDSFHESLGKELEELDVKYGKHK